MKRRATGLLLAATVVFVVTRVLEEGTPWLGFVRATAEAAMVGAVADWFAVTALFRHPLGLPIPHTAIIPSARTTSAGGWAPSCSRTSSPGAVVEDRLAGVSVAARLGAWLAEPAHAGQVADQAAGVVRSTLDTLRDEDVQEALETAVARRVRAIEAGPVLARGIELAVADGRHQELLSVLLAKVAEVVDENEDVLRARLEEETPRWLPSRVDDRIFTRVHTGVQRFLAGGGRGPGPPDAGHARPAGGAPGRRPGPLPRHAGPGRRPQGGAASTTRPCATGRPPSGRT